MMRRSNSLVNIHTYAGIDLPEHSYTPRIEVCCSMPRSISKDNTLLCKDQRVVVCLRCIAAVPHAEVHDFRTKKNLHQHTVRHHPTCVLLYRQHSSCDKAINTLVFSAYLDLALERRGLRVWRDVKSLPSAVGLLKNVVLERIERSNSIVIILSSGDLESARRGDFFRWEIETCLRHRAESIHWVFLRSAFNELMSTTVHTCSDLSRTIKIRCNDQFVHVVSDEASLQLASENIYNNIYAATKNHA